MLIWGKFSSPVSSPIFLLEIFTPL